MHARSKVSCTSYDGGWWLVQGNVLFVRFFEGKGSKLIVNKTSTGPDRLKTILGSLVDVPLIMNTMQDAIRRAVMTSR